MTKKSTLILTLAALLSCPTLQAQTGDTAVASATAASENGWQNWAFTAIALVVAAGAVYSVAVDAGHEAHHDAN